MEHKNASKECIDKETTGKWNAILEDFSAYTTIQQIIIKYVCCLILNVLWHKEVISNRNGTRCFPLVWPGFEPDISGSHSPADWMPDHKPTELSTIKLNNLDSKIRPYDSAHLALLPEFDHPWLWRYTYSFLDTHNYVYWQYFKYYTCIKMSISFFNTHIELTYFCTTLLAPELARVRLYTEIPECWNISISW